MSCEEVVTDDLLVDVVGLGPFHLVLPREQPLGASEELLPPHGQKGLQKKEREREGVSQQVSEEEKAWMIDCVSLTFFLSKSRPNPV